MPEGMDEIRWIAFVSSPFSVDSWFMITGEDENEELSPLEPIVPGGVADAVAAVAGSVTSEGSSEGIESLARLDVPAGERKSWDLAAGVEEFFWRFVRISYGGDRADLEGVLVLALARDLGAGIIRVDDTVEHARACVVDRLRLAYAAETTSVRVLASMDDGYQQELIRGRQAPGLREFIMDLESGPERLLTEGEQAGVSGPREMRSGTSIQSGVRATGPRTEAYASADVLRQAFELAVGALAPEGPKTITQLRVIPDPRSRLQTPVGRWLGWAEYRYGFGGMRTRSAVAAVATDGHELHRQLATFLYELKGRKGDVGLVLLVPKEFHSEAVAVASEWRKVIDVACGVLPE